MQNEEEVRVYLSRAADSLQAAQSLRGENLHDIAASRAYYGAFYAATAPHLAEGRSYRKHSGVISAIHQHFVYGGRLDAKSGKDLKWLFELRSVGDYGGSDHVTEEEATKAIQAGNRFLENSRSLLQGV